MPCPNCGAVNPDGESWCFNCGAPLVTGPVKYGRKLPITSTDVKQAVYHAPAVTARPRKSRKTAILAIVIGLLIGAGIGLHNIFYTLEDNPNLGGNVYYSYEAADIEHDDSYVHCWGTIHNTATHGTSCRVWIHIYDDMGHSKKKTVDLGSLGAGESVPLSTDISWPYDYADDWMYHIDGEVRFVY